MKTHGFKAAVVLWGFFLILFTVWIGGCALTPPPERTDREKVKQNSMKSMQELKDEEERGDKGY
jgi:hypothetical protein